MPKHIVRLLLLLAAFGAIAVAAKIYFVPKSFWTYGHYRAASVAEIAGDVPMYKGSQYCQTCHRQESTEWSAGAHRLASAGGVRRGVNCEDCHGPAGRHPLSGKPPSTDTRTHEVLMAQRYNLVTGKMRVPKNTAQLCGQCHEKMPGRPAAQPQIVVSAHAGRQQCITCHDPHTPAIVFPPIPEETLAGLPAAGKAASAPCAACHGANGMSPSPPFPNLAAQRRAYLAATLEAYKTGARKASVMKAVAAGLSKTEIGNLAAYFSGLARQTAASAPLPSAADARKARAEACMTCHGEGGVSRNPVVPTLAGQNEAYLASALEAYRTGARQDALMVRIAHHLTAADIKELAAYYARLPAGAKPPLPRHAEVNRSDDR